MEDALLPISVLIWSICATLDSSFVDLCPWKFNVSSAHAEHTRTATGPMHQKKGPSADAVNGEVMNFYVFNMAAVFRGRHHPTSSGAYLIDQRLVIVVWRMHCCRSPF